jgi:hypothetical protein
MSAVLALIFFFGRDSEKFLCRQGLGMSDWIADHLVFSEQLELCVAKAQRTLSSKRSLREPLPSFFSKLLRKWQLTAESEFR